MGAQLTPVSDHVMLATFDHGIQALVTLASRDRCENKTTTINYEGEAYRMRSWGNKNDLPQLREFILKENNIVGSLIGTKRNILLGGGLQPYKERWDPEQEKYIREPLPIPAEAMDFFEANDIDEYLIKSANNLLMHGQLFTEFRRGKGGMKNKIVRIGSQHCKYMRAQEQDDFGVIKNWYFSTQWVREKGRSRNFTRKIETVPNYDREKMRKALKEGIIPWAKFIWRVGDDLFSDGYYYEPAWWGGREWIELSNCIPQFHQANLKHGYTLRYHITYKSDYFNVEPQGNTDQHIKDAQDAAKKNLQETMNQVNSFLAGIHNTGRALWTKFDFDEAVMKEIPGIKIEPLKVDLQDEALLKLFEKSNEANISAQGLHPTLANVQTQGKLSSGSEMRIAYQTYLAIHTPTPRRLLLKPIELIHKINGWPKDVKWGFRDIEITKLDVEKTGQQNVIEN